MPFIFLKNTSERFRGMKTQSQNHKTSVKPSLVNECPFCSNVLCLIPCSCLISIKVISMDRLLFLIVSFTTFLNEHYLLSKYISSVSILCQWLYFHLVQIIQQTVKLQNLRQFTGQYKITYGTKPTDYSRKLFLQQKPQTCYKGRAYSLKTTVQLKFIKFTI